jgi:hypothetical protein
VIISTPHTHNAGYFLNNSSLVRREQADIQLCTHCEIVINLQLWKVDGGWCNKCFAPICGPCADRMLTHGCDPFMKRIEAAFETAIQLRQHRRLAGLDAAPANYVPKILVTT